MASRSEEPASVVAPATRSLGEILDSVDDGATVADGEANMEEDEDEELVKETEAPDGYCIECEGGSDLV